MKQNPYYKYITKIRTINGLILFPIIPLLPFQVLLGLLFTKDWFGKGKRYSSLNILAVFICNKFAVYAWNFGDIFIIIISRALYGKFKGFVEIMEKEIQHKVIGWFLFIKVSFLVALIYIFLIQTGKRQWIIMISFVI